jgi:hypothetical protein
MFSLSLALALSLSLSLNIWNISHSKKNSARYYHKYTQVLRQSIVIFCYNLIQLELSHHIFEKHSNVEFHEIRLLGVELLHAEGRKDSQVSNFMKIRQFGVELLHAEGRKDSQVSNFMKIRQFGVELLHAEGRKDSQV